MKELKKYNIYKHIQLLLVGLTILVAGCEKEPGIDSDPGLPQEIQTLNNWIWEGMNDLYLWKEFLPNIDPRYEEDPEAYFYKLLYADDRDSWITDDYEELIAMFDGVQLATGMSASPGRIDETRVISVLEYVTPNTPAADSGISRGDVIISIDGKGLTVDNYFDLYYQTTATFGFGTWDGINLVPDGREIQLTAVELNQNPFIHHEIIDYQGYKIGYYVYSSFVPGPNNEWMDEMDRVLGEFKSAGVTDVVVDLRYNGGGYGYVAEKMGSILAPSSVVTSKSIFATQIWNKEFTERWKKSDLNNDGKPDGNESPRLISRFPDSDLNLNLSKLYFLTSGRTASASEQLMVSLYPYAEVIQIGTVTYGKCFGSVTIDDWETPKRHNWAMQPIVLKYANADGYTDFVDGLTPDFVVEESLLNAAPFGSEEDPLLARALEEITGVTPAMKKRAVTSYEFELLPVPRKQLPEIKLDWPLKQGSTETW